MVEKGDLGGICVNVGCIFKKLMFYSVYFYEDFVDVVGYGWILYSEFIFDWLVLIVNKDCEIMYLNGIY